MSISIVEVLTSLESSYQKPFCRLQIGRNYRISLGFGEKDFHHSKRLRDDFYGRWEMASFYCNWQLVLEGAVIADGNNRDIDTIQLEKLIMPCISMVKRIFNPDPCSVRVEFENSASIDFFASPEADDKIFHLFYPPEMFVSFLPAKGWETKPSRVK